MKQGDQIVVTGLAAVSPVGANVEQTCASIRAGINRFQAHPFYHPRLPEPPLSEPQPAMISPVIPFDPSTLLPERLMQLALAPMKDLIASAKLRRDDFKSAAVLVSLPDVERTGHLSGYEKRFIGEYFQRLAIEPGPIRQVFQEGHTGVFTAIGEATRLLRSGTCRFCIVLGVDSYLDKESIDRFDAAYRLKSERNVDGFIPGESAVLLLLETREHAKARKTPLLAKIDGLGRGVEKENIASEKASSGRGLSDAIAQLNGDAIDRPASWVICDLNGESGRSREWGMVLCRSAASFSQLKKLSHPADCVGEVGAASGALSIAVACRAFARGYAPGREALLWTASDSGQRAACRIGSPNEK